MRTLKTPKQNSKICHNVAYPARAAFVANEIVLSSKSSGADLFFILLESQNECEGFYAKLGVFFKLFKIDATLRILPEIRESSGQNAENFDAHCERIGTLNYIYSAKSSEINVVLSTPEAFFAHSPKPNAAEFLNLKVKDKISIDALKETLVKFGYFNEVLCESPAQFAIRGGIVDVYPLAASSPLRIDFFGDEIESIRTFEPDTQLSDGKVNSVRIDSANEIESENSATTYDYIEGKKVSWFFLEPSVLAQKFPQYFSIPEFGIPPQKCFAKVFERNDNFLGVASLNLDSGLFEDSAKQEFYTADLSEFRPPSNIEAIGYEAYEAENELRTRFIKKLIEWENSGCQIFLEANSESEKKRIAELFLDCGYSKPHCEFVGQICSEGFIFTFEAKAEGENKKSSYRLLMPAVDSKKSGVVFVSAYEFFGRRIKVNLAPRRKMLSHRAQVDQLLDFSELGEGDYVVHLGHGVCRYHGVVDLDIDGVKQEVIKLEFEDEANLYLPLHKSHLISRYIGLDKASPKLSRLDSKSWIKVKSAAETAAFDYASELLEIQSKREIAEGFAYPDDDKWQKSFDDSFPFVETPDQLRAIEEVKSDMSQAKPMERLICADVGFGKTEIAMRAAFKSALAGKQVAVLCPTTILAQQHFKNFKERMGAYPIVVEMLSRFRTSSEASKIKAQVSLGKIDIIIGTHALLSDTLKFKDLGLLVVDEEHRFGVKHKEKIKKIKQSIDVLTMSATPIPRTLYFAMMGAKQISLIETPPKNRFPVETVVKEYSDKVVEEAINAEISRGGQVFYLHNRVKTIDEVASRLKLLFPNLRIAVGHGQMTELKLEKLMAEFVDGKYDILVCTTIIESGLDIQNCNTIIIEGADKFGLSQLYQLRGRVGRFTRRAYAYLLLHRHANLVESARKRLGAIRQYNTVGAGFRIATRDLQLRGCGNLLGAKQSGHIAGVGFEMYCRLLKRSIAILKGEKNAAGIKASLHLDFVKFGHGIAVTDELDRAENYYQEIRIKEMSKHKGETLEAHIPPSYISQVQLRIDLYRRIEMSVSLPELEKILSDTLDRFGALPPELRTLFDITQIRILAELNGFSAVETEAEKLKLRIPNTKNTEYFRVLGRFPRLTNVDSRGKLAEIKNFLKNIVKTIR